MGTLFNLEQEALASRNYLEELVDPATGFTYFDVYLTRPAEAAHDWPDFLDVPGRSAEACVLLRHMTGQPVATEEAFFRRLYGFQAEDGLFYRPETRLIHHAMHREEQALVMGALVARTLADADHEAETRLRRQVVGLTQVEDQPGPFPAMLLRPLARVWEALQWAEARDMGLRLRDRLIGEQPLFRPDGSFAGHVHSHLYAAAGLAEVGRLSADAALIEQMSRVFQVIRSRSTAFGFVPELTERTDDVIGCETCCLMDYIHLALSLAKAGHREYYDDVERAVRNHLVESRVKHGDWLPESPGARDDEYLRRERLREAVVGAYAGWSGPNHLLAYDEYLPAAWIKSPELAPIYLNKVRALQNCCSPSGPKALYLAWQHAAQAEAGMLRVNLLMDRDLPEAEVRGYEPYAGRVDVTLRAPLRIALRRPGIAAADSVQASVKGQMLPLRLEDGYLVTPTLEPGVRIQFHYPLPERTETILIGNKGFQQYAYSVTWRGSTVMGIKPEDNPITGRSHLMADPVRLYYGTDGPHPLYQRQTLLEKSLEPGPLHQTGGPRVW